MPGKGQRKIAGIQCQLAEASISVCVGVSQCRSTYRNLSGCALVEPVIAGQSVQGPQESTLLREVLLESPSVGAPKLPRG